MKKIYLPSELVLIKDYSDVLPGPKPVIVVTCRDMESKRANVMPISFFGQISRTIKNVSKGIVYLGISPKRHTHKLIMDEKEFVVNYPTADYVKEVDYFGLVSGKDIDKLKKTMLTIGNDPKWSMDTPYINEFPLNIGYKLINTMASDGEHTIFIAQVKVVRRNYKPGGAINWLFHEGHNYFGALSGSCGRVYGIGKELLKHT